VRLQTDDALRQIDARWLGPKGTSLPWAARYSAYATGLVVALVLLALEHRAGIGFSPVSAGWTLALVVAITTAFHRGISHDRPVRCVLLTFRDEVRGPRPPSGWSCQYRVPRLTKPPAAAPRQGRRRRWRS
jgi:hypothetical protein